MAGTPAQARTRDYVINQMKSWGLETEVRSYSVWMPHPLSTRVWRIAPDPIELNLQGRHRPRRHHVIPLFLR